MAASRRAASIAAILATMIALLSSAGWAYALAPVAAPSTDPADPLWDSTWSGPAGGSDMCWDISTSSDGSVYALVKSTDPGETAFTFYVVKYFGDGSPAPGWPKAVSSTTENNSTGAVTVDSNDNVWAAGEHGPSGTTNIRVCRYLPDGSTVPGWPKDLDPGDGDDTPCGMAVDGDDNILLAGRAHVAGVQRAMLTKMRQDGSAYPGFPVIESAVVEATYRDVAVDNLGNSYVVGEVDLAGNDPWLINSYTPGGSQRAGWFKTVARGGHDGLAMGAAIDATGRLVVGGFYYGADQFGTLIAYDASGTLVGGWPRDYTYQGNNTILIDVAADAEGHLLAVGMGGSGLVLYRLSSSGDSLPGWPVEYLPASVGTSGRCLTLDRTESIVVGGTISTSPDPATADSLTLKYPPGGADGRTWYLAEGSTGPDPGGGFETWVLVCNAGTTHATANLTYMTPQGEVAGPTVELEPGTRQTVNVADVLPNEWSVSTKVTSDQPVIAERAMYWNGRKAATDSIGYDP